MNEKSIISSATEKALDITPSVLSLAVACGITPAKFVKAYMDTKARALFLADVTAGIVHDTIIEAQKETV